jgi:GTPase Era involved in 16S rRNA processing
MITYAIIQEGVEQELPLNVEAADVVKISKKLQSQNFRLAVLGEFSQGKSSLLNALLGEKIQPVRALPCSGTISILRYGTEKRVICRYRDGRQEEIALEEYKEKAAIPKEVAMGGTLREALTQTEIQELIFEHPNLELCKNGVEIIDSPGLNEHPDRTALTYQLLKETDAAIFLASAKHPLTESEQSLLQELKTQLNDGRSERPATNLFVAVNFMDLLDEEEDNPQDIQQRFERLLRGNPPVLMGENRIHYISAKSALNALLKGQENQYLQSFQHFTQAIEAFLTQERGVLQLQKSVEDMTEVIQTLQSTLQTAKGAVEGELISHAKKAEFLEQIAEAGGREVKLMILAEELSNEVCDKFDKAWDKWAEGLEDRLLEKVDGWNSSHSKTFSQDKVIQDYVDQFFRDVTYELDCFQDQHFAPILEGAMKILDQAIARELKALQGQSQAFDKRISSKASRVLDKQVSGIESHFFVGKLKYLALPALAFLPGLILPVAIGAGLGALTGFFDGDQATKLKLKVFDAGCEKFSESLDSVVQQLVESIVKAFDDRVEGATEAIQQVMQSYETAIAQQEKAASRSPEHTKAMRAWIVQKNQELEQLEKSLKSFQTQMLQ